jgi:lysine biosynthesis protein LysW
MLISKCPACGSDIIIEDGVVVGDLASCNNCGVDSEIVSLSPLVLGQLESETSGDTAEEEEN